MVLDASLLNTQHYKVWLKGKWSNPEKLVVASLKRWFIANEKVAFGHPRLQSANLQLKYMYTHTLTHPEKTSDI